MTAESRQLSTELRATSQVLTEDLWRYLSVLYIDRKGGMNLRNDLAHGLASAESFSRPIADRVFHSLLALSLIRANKAVD